MWSVPERRELDVVDVHEMVTAAAWVPPAGGRAAVATLKGKVRYYSADEHGRLEYEAQVGGCLCSIPTHICWHFPGTLRGVIAHLWPRWGSNLGTVRDCAKQHAVMH